jgi:hypothetical protein
LTFATPPGPSPKSECQIQNSTRNLYLLVWWFATFSKVKNWGVYTIKDGLLITGQNPASSEPTAKVLIEALKAK